MLTKPKTELDKVHVCLRTVEGQCQAYVVTPSGEEYELPTTGVSFHRIDASSYLLADMTVLVSKLG